MLTLFSPGGKRKRQERTGAEPAVILGYNRLGTAVGDAIVAGSCCEHRSLGKCSPISGLPGERQKYHRHVPVRASRHVLLLCRLKTYRGVRWSRE
jgi:hypothetical protein